jgi:hypothetical protein
MKINPYQIVYKKGLLLFDQGEEHNIVNFVIDKSGGVLDVYQTADRLVRSAEAERTPITPSNSYPSP